ATRVDGKRFVQSEFCGEICDWMWPQDARVSRAPSTIVVEVLAEAAVSVVDASMQDELGGTRFKLFQRELSQQRNRVLIEFAPARGIEIEKQAGGVMVPAPPQIAGQRPQAFLNWRDKAVEGTRFTDNWCQLRCGFGEHSYFIGTKYASF